MNPARRSCPMYGSLIMMHFLQGRLIIVWLVFLGSLFSPHCPTPNLGTCRNGDSPLPPDNVAFCLIRGSGRSCSWLDRTLSPSLTAGQLWAENPLVWNHAIFAPRPVSSAFPSSALVTLPQNLEAKKPWGVYDNMTTRLGLRGKKWNGKWSGASATSQTPVPRAVPELWVPWMRWVCW